MFREFPTRLMMMLRWSQHLDTQVQTFRSLSVTQVWERSLLQVTGKCNSGNEFIWKLPMLWLHKKKKVSIF